MWSATRCVPNWSSRTIVTQVKNHIDDFDRRIAITVDPDGSGVAAATATSVVYDGPSLVANSHIEFFDPDASGVEPPALNARRLYAPAVDAILARIPAVGAVAWYLTDQIGSVRDLVNITGTVQDHINYEWTDSPPGIRRAPATR
jgi:hypothetical protein